MVQQATKLPTLDNSGAQLIECINVLKRHPKDRGKTGSLIVAAVKKKGNSTKVKQGQVLKGMIITTKYNILRKNGIKVKFNKNGAILLNEQLAPLATRIIGPLTRELRKKRIMKMLSMAKRII
jgi:large subunit ribosomal protein L14